MFFNSFSILSESNRICDKFSNNLYKISNEFPSHRFGISGQNSLKVATANICILLCLKWKLLWQLCAAMMSWVRRWVELVILLNNSELFILFAENSQILFKISVIPILLTFIYLVALNLLVNNQVNSSSNSTHHWGT